ncbi:YesL family protein [Enterococcus sp. LJL90]
MENLARGSVRIGELILFVAKLQLFWVVSVLRLGIITGIFPSTAAVLEYFYKGFRDLEAVAILKEKAFFAVSKGHFKGANYLGFISVLIGLILYLDWRISSVFIENRFFQIALFIFVSLVVMTLIYLLPCYVRYQMPLKDYFKQAFFLMLCSIPNSFAIFLGSTLIIMLFMMFPVFSLAPVPMLMLPTAWFSHQAMLRLEKQSQAT